MMDYTIHAMVKTALEAHSDSCVPDAQEGHKFRSGVLMACTPKCATECRRGTRDCLVPIGASASSGIAYKESCSWLEKLL